jgi:hypothetical protein
MPLMMERERSLVVQYSALPLGYMDRSNDLSGLMVYVSVRAQEFAMPLRPCAIQGSRLNSFSRSRLA